MSRTRRRKTAYWLERYYTVGEWDWSWSANKEGYSEQIAEYHNSFWWYQHLSRRYQCSIDQLPGRTKAWFHLDNKKGVWNDTCYYGRRLERSYRHMTKELCRRARLDPDPEYAVYDLPIKAKNVAQLRAF